LCLKHILDNPIF